MHTLILIGELDRASAHTLEAEIEHLCEAGTSGITLDLRKLTHINMTGVAVIAFRTDLCRRRGFEFALIPGPWFIQRPFERAGLSERLPFLSTEEYPLEPEHETGPMPAPHRGGASEPAASAPRRRIPLAQPTRSFALLRMWQSQRSSAGS